MKCYYCENFEHGYCRYINAILCEEEIEYDCKCEGENVYVGCDDPED